MRETGKFHSSRVCKRGEGTMKGLGILQIFLIQTIKPPEPREEKAGFLNVVKKKKKKKKKCFMTRSGTSLEERCSRKSARLGETALTFKP